jgi:hypothetical protein
VIVTLVPPAAGPSAGAIDATMGGRPLVDGVTVKLAVCVVPPYRPLIATEAAIVTGDVETVNVAALAPEGTFTLAGTVATVVLPLDNDTAAPPDGAFSVRVAVPCTVPPPATLVGFSEIAASVALGEGGGGGDGTTVSVSAFVTPPNDALMRTAVGEATVVVEPLNV